jgi:tetratricopeptide (TPR) repeat protein
MKRERMRCASIAILIGASMLLGLASCASTGPSPVAQEWFDLGNAWLEKGDWKKAGQAYSHALTLDPSFAGASYNLARALTESGDYEMALKVLDALASRDPGNVDIVAARAYALYKKGDAKDALAAYRELLALDAYAPDAVYNAALLELASGDASTAVADLERLTSAKPDDGQAFLLLGRAIDRRASNAATIGKTTAAGGGGSAALNESDASALAAYEKAMALGKTDADALVRMSQLYEKTRRFSEAMDALEEALKADPKRAAAAFYLARLRLVVADDAEKGLAALKVALDNGFSDKDAASSLLAEPDLPERQKVFDLLKAKGLTE